MQNTIVINRKAKKLAMRLKISMTGGSDAHTPEEVGSAYTLFPDWVKDEEDAIKAIKDGKISAGGRSQPIISLISYDFNKLLRWIGRRGRRI